MPTPALAKDLWKSSSAPPPPVGPPSGMIAWYKADDGVYQDTGGSTPANQDGQPVALMQDRGSTGYNALQSTSGLRPVLRTGVQHSLPMVEANGSNRFLDVGSQLGTPANWTELAVLKMPAIPNTQIPFGALYLAGYPRGTWGLLEVDWPATPGALSVQWADGLLLSRTATFSREISPSEAMMLRLQYVDGDNICTIAKNGTVLSVHSIVNAASHTSGTPTAYALFRAGDYSAEYFAGMIGELIVYDRSLSAGDIAQAESYLLDRWGL